MKMNKMTLNALALVIVGTHVSAMETRSKANKKRKQQEAGYFQEDSSVESFALQKKARRESNINELHNIARQRTEKRNARLVEQAAMSQQDVNVNPVVQPMDVDNNGINNPIHAANDMMQEAHVQMEADVLQCMDGIISTIEQNAVNQVNVPVLPQQENNQMDVDNNGINNPVMEAQQANQEFVVLPVVPTNDDEFRAENNFFAALQPAEGIQQVAPVVVPNNNIAPVIINLVHNDETNNTSWYRQAGQASLSVVSGLMGAVAAEFAHEALQIPVDPSFATAAGFAVGSIPVMVYNYVYAPANQQAHQE